jgi:phage terminase large subunit-like protein
MASDALRAMLRSAQRALAKTDVATFIEYTTGQEPAKHHLDMIDFAIDIVDRKGKGVVLEPRGAGKTTILTTGFLPWLIATRPDIRIGLFSQKDKKAEAMSDAIMNIVSGSPEFIEVFGNLRGTHKWTASEWLVKGSPHFKTKDRTMVTGGAAQSSGAVSKRFDLLLLDDILDENNTATIDQREKTETWFWKTLKPAQAAEGCAILVIGCLATGTPVLMADGTWRAIEQVRVGEQVWSVDDSTLAAGPRTVEAVLDQGVAPTYRIKTRTSIVEATGQHPFLAWSEGPYGRKTRGGSPVWKRADEIAVGDYIVEVKESDGEVQFDWMDEEFCWLLGFLFGDGWLTRNDVVCCALGSDEAMNQKMLAALESWFPTVAFRRTPFGYVRGDNRVVVEALRELGFNGTAKTKRLPAWLFRSPATFKRAFLRGLCDADGSSAGSSGMAEAEALELANGNLIEDVRRLALTCGIRPGGVTSRTRVGNAPHSKTPTVAESWRVHLNFAKAREMELGDGRSRHTTSGDPRLGMRWRLAKVKSVESVGEQQVWDLTVEGTHTFVADGLAVHNTRWTEGDLYQQLIEVNKWDSLVVPAITEVEGVEQSYWPSVWPLERLYAEREDVGWDNFACSYLNSVSNREGAIFKADWWRETYFDALPRDRTYTFTIGIDLATSVRERADFTAGVVCARDDRNEWWVLHHARVKTDDGHRAFVQSLWDWCAEQGYKVSRIVMESNQAQEAIVTAIQRQTPLPVIGRRTDVDKRSKARGAATFYESHRVHHHSSLKGRELESELRSFDKGHDDLVDALCLAMDITGHSGTTLGVSAPPQGIAGGLGGMVAAGSLLPFADGAREVPAHLASLLKGIPTETLSYEEALAAMNTKRLNDYVRSAMRGVLR